MALDAVDERVGAVVSGPTGGGEPADDVLQEHLSVVQGFAETGKRVTNHLDVIRNASRKELLNAQIGQLGRVLGVDEIRHLIIIRTRLARLGKQIIGNRANSLSKSQRVSRKPPLRYYYYAQRETREHLPLGTGTLSSTPERTQAMVNR